MLSFDDRIMKAVRENSFIGVEEERFGDRGLESSRVLQKAKVSKTF